MSSERETKEPPHVEATIVSDKRENGQLSQVEGLKLDAYLSAFVKSRTELSRRILTISSAAVGLVLTLAASLNSLTSEVRILMGASLVAFAGAIYATMMSIWKDGEYLLHASKDLGREGRSKETKKFGAETRCWGEIGRWLFGAGVVILVVLGITTINLN